MQNVYSIRNDTTFSFAKGGRHTLQSRAPSTCTSSSPIAAACAVRVCSKPPVVPSRPTSKQLFPDQFDVTTWQLDRLSPITFRWRQSIGDGHSSEIPRHTSAVWIQDDWSAEFAADVESRPAL